MPPRRQVFLSWTAAVGAAQALEGGEADSAGMGPAFDLHAGHLGGAEGAFLARWLALVDLEEGDVAARRALIWRLTGAPAPPGSTPPLPSPPAAPPSLLCPPGASRAGFHRCLGVRVPTRSGRHGVKMQQERNFGTLARESDQKADPPREVATAGVHSAASTQS